MEEAKEVRAVARPPKKQPADRLSATSIGGPEVIVRRAEMIGADPDPRAARSALGGAALIPGRRRRRRWLCFATGSGAILL